VGDTPTLVIRRACERDIPSISDIYVRAFPHLFLFIWRASIPDSISLLSELYRSGALCLSDHWVAEMDGRVAGFAEVYAASRPTPMRSAAAVTFIKRLGPLRGGLAYSLEAGMRWFFRMRAPRAGTAYLMTLAVAEEERGKGIGKALVEHAAYLGLEEGCGALALHVVKRNVAARRLYEQMGFVECREARRFPLYLAIITRLLGRASAPNHSTFMVRPLSR
jgi:ribosomal protein S18 acetylase RimI-like enzyme